MMMAAPRAACRARGKHDGAIRTHSRTKPQRLSSVARSLSSSGRCLVSQACKGGALTRSTGRPRRVH